MKFSEGGMVAYGGYIGGLYRPGHICDGKSQFSQVCRHRSTNPCFGAWDCTYRLFSTDVIMERCGKFNIFAFSSMG